MAIQPIDLQTLYSQLEKVGKAQIQQQQAAQALQDSEMTANKAKAERKLKTVEKTPAGDETSGEIHAHNGAAPSRTDIVAEHNGRDRKDRNRRQKQPGETGEPGEESDRSSDGAGQSAEEIIRDPALGKHVDISG